MELVRISDNVWYTFQRNGSDRNGNSKYLVEIFQEFGEDNIQNITYMVATRNNKVLNKYGSIPVKCYKNQIRDIVVRMVESGK